MPTTAPRTSFFLSLFAKGWCSVSPNPEWAWTYATGTLASERSPRIASKKACWRGPGRAFPSITTDRYLPFRRSRVPRTKMAILSSRTFCTCMPAPSVTVPWTRCRPKNRTPWWSFEKISGVDLGRSKSPAEEAVVLPPFTSESSFSSASVVPKAFSHRAKAVIWFGQRIQSCSPGTTKIGTGALLCRRLETSCIRAAGHMPTEASWRFPRWATNSASAGMLARSCTSCCSVVP
mmetsp:Transcript_25978/g.55631  ORF Transcript_25978/g.55631 Transcript_25978/m.55631 type:complete len:234 (-) Transcript_25978:1008-1709(-)